LSHCAARPKLASSHSFSHSRSPPLWPIPGCPSHLISTFNISTLPSICHTRACLSKRHLPSPVVMSTSQATSGGASLASPPPPTQLNREPSREELESARVLNLLNGSGGFLGVPTSHSSHQQPGASSDDVAPTPSPDGGRRPSEVSEYHSLDDTLSYRNAARSPQSSSQDPSGSTTRHAATGNPSITGQICR
jgi:hypothetical protein